MHLLAETSGKNAIVITQAADLDLAIRDLVRSAFGHAGQKCSAASLAIVEAPLYDDASFMERLADATRSLVVGPPSDPGSVVGPLIGEPSAKLRRGAHAARRRRAVAGRAPQPRRRPVVARRARRCAARLVVPRHRVLRAGARRDARRRPRSGDRAAERARRTVSPAASTRSTRRRSSAGSNGVRVGNAYVNRGITGAIVQRQPFGGWKRSSVGCGPKAGGPDYVAEQVTGRRPAVDRERCRALVPPCLVGVVQLQSRSDGSGQRAQRPALPPLDGVLVRVGSRHPGRRTAGGTPCRARSAERR